MQNVLECYLIILKNNEEILNKKIDEIKTKDANLRQKEFILNRLKNPLKKPDQNFTNITETEMEEFESPTMGRMSSSKLDNKQKQSTVANLRNSNGKINSDNSTKIQTKVSTGNIQSGLSQKKSTVFNGVKDDDSLRKTMKDSLKGDDLAGEKKRLNRSVIVERKTIDTKKDIQNQFNSKSNLVRLAPETPRDPKQKNNNEIKTAQADKRTTTKIDPVSTQKKFETNNSKVGKAPERPADNHLNNSKNSKPAGDVKSEKTEKKVDNSMKIDPSEKKEINAKLAKAQAEKKEIREIKIDPSERDRKVTQMKRDDNKITNEKNIVNKNSQNSSLNTSLTTAGLNDNKKKSVTSPSSNENKNYQDLDVKSTSSTGTQMKKDNQKNFKDSEEINKISEPPKQPDNQIKSNIFNEVKTKLVTKNENEIKHTQQDSANGDVSNDLGSNEINTEVLKEKKKKRKKSKISREDNSLDTSQELERKPVRDREASRFSSNEEKFMVRSSIFGSRSSSMIDDQLDRSDVNLEADPFDPSGGFAEIRNIRNILKERAEDSNVNKNLVGNKLNDDSVDLFKHPSKNCRNIYN